MIKKLFILFFVVASASLTAQREAANWYFGFNAGLDFNSGSPISQNGQLSSEEACASISDSDGNLLFYTDGVRVYNANHVLMPNGAGLWGHESTTQGAIIIPQPGNPDRYYIFTQDYQGEVRGLAYTVVDMTLDGGLGGVVATEKNIQLSTPTTEKMTAAFHANGEDIWVIAHVYGTNEFLAYLVTAGGVSTVPVVSAVGEVATIMFGAGSTAGYLKTSPNGKKLASAKQVALSGLELYDFDASGGIISNAQKITSSSVYGVEFSADSKVLYASSSGGIRQYDITQSNLAAIQASELIMASGIQHGALQLGIDGKVYAARYNLNFLSVINNPGILGLGCNFIQDATLLSPNTKSGFGLPNFLTSYFQFELGFKDLCAKQPTQMEIISRSNIATASWNFGDPGSGANNTSTTIQPSHIYAIPGTYTVTVTLTTDVGYSITLTNMVTIIASPVANKPSNLITCDVLPNDGFAQFTLSNQTATILGTQPSADYSVAYYASEDDARAENMALPQNYTNTSNPQTIYARVTSNANDCYDLTTFTVTVNPTAEVTDPDDQEACEETPGSGISHFDLTQSIPEITNGANGLSVTFYKTQSDLNNNIPITTPTNYTNTTPGGETVYFQAADPAAPDCKAGGSLDLVVNGQPPLNTNIPVYKQCDYNNPGDGFESFDLTSMYPSITSTPGLTLTYEYQSAGTRVAIADPTNFTNTISNQQTIYVSTTNNSGCKSEVSFVIKVNPLPGINSNLQPFYACEELQGQGKFNLPQISQGLTSTSTIYTVKYYTGITEAEAGGTDNLPDFYTTAPTTIYARVSDIATGCFTITPVVLEVIPAPIAAVPAPLEICDTNNDGFGVYNLDPVIQAIQASLGNVVVTVHETP
ncbi:PKD domain-containing protein, partial [Flavobacterium cerinum]